MNHKPRKHSRTEIYPVLISFDDSVRVTFWIDPGAPDRDNFIKLPNGKIATAQTSSDVAAIFKDARSVNIHWSEFVLIDVALFLRRAHKMRKGQVASKGLCSSFLDAWNHLEDLARTLDLHVPLQSIKGNPILNRVYQKIYQRLDLPLPNPKDAESTLEWSQREVKEFAPAMNRLWRAILHVAPEIIGRDSKSR